MSAAPEAPAAGTCCASAAEVFLHTPWSTEAAEITEAFIIVFALRESERCVHHVRKCLYIV